MNNQKLPEIYDVVSAYSCIQRTVIKTPLLNYPELDERVGGRIFLKAENLQRSGSFKFRGALNKLLSIPKIDRKSGVIACSSGNHAQGVALAAKILGINACIVMPADAPTIKIQKTLNYGGDVVFYDRIKEDREEKARLISKESGRIMVHPYNDPKVIAGQGTSALEALEQLEVRGKNADNYLICTGGGGLTAGSALVISERSPKTKLYTVEPAEFDDHMRSFVSGNLETNNELGGSICDALLAPSPGELSFKINKSKVTSGLVVTDQQVAAAVKFAYYELKLVVEPGGAVGLAAILANKLDVKGQTTVVVLTGGNIDTEMLNNCLGSGKDGNVTK